MYIPEPFRLDDRAAAVEIMRQNSFAVLVTAPGGRVQASHLPVIYDAGTGGHGCVHGHMAKANPQWRDFAALAEADGEAMVVFQGPHGYISPRWYRPGDAVPTWNYVAVHAYGRPQLIEDPAAVRAHQEHLVAVHEAGNGSPWSMAGQDEAYIQRMLRGIVAFEIPVTRLEAKAKLSQNRSAADQRGVIAALEDSGRSHDGDLAETMRRTLAID